MIRGAVLPQQMPKPLPRQAAGDAMQHVPQALHDSNVLSRGSCIKLKRAGANQ
jgi:hypothetical protein